MDYLIALGLIAGGFITLIFGGDGLVKSAVSLAARLKISPAIIGLTIIAAGTSAPEAVTSLVAALKGSADVAIGNVVGSNIFNLMAILGVAALIKPFIAPKELFKYEFPVLIGSSLLLLWLCWDQQVTAIEGGIFLIVLFATLFWSLKLAATQEVPDDEISKLKTPAHDFVYLVAGCGALVLGANLALEGGVQLGRLFGLTERVIGITILSVGTGLPELITSVVASMKGRNDIAVANVIGSNLMNTLGVTGLAGTIAPMAISKDLVHFDMLAMVIVTILGFVAIALNKYHFRRGQGLVILFAYCLYLYQLI